MRSPLRVLAALAACSLLSGCLAGYSRPEGVMPAGEVMPPPSLRGTATGRSLAAAKAADAPEPDAAPTARASRALSVPNRAAGGVSATSERRVRREDLEDNGAGAAGGGSSLSPTISPSGSVGVGGRF